MSCTDDATVPMADVREIDHRPPAEPTPAQLQALWVPIALFVIVSIADTVSSVYMLANGVMEEFNPLMRRVWEAGGPVTFVAVKALLTLVPVWIFNRLKVIRYGLVYRAVWITLLGYAVIYCLLFVMANF